MRRSLPPPSRAALYARQSLTRPMDGATRPPGEQASRSLNIQVDTCRRTAAFFGIDIVRELVEPPSTSGYKNRGRNRPRFTELLDLICTGEVDAIVVYATDRLSRGGGPGYAPLFEALEQAGCDIDHAVLTANGWVSEMELSIRAAMDREESRKFSMRMSDVSYREALRGHRRARMHPGFGYTADMHVNRHQARLIREARDRALAGDTWADIAADWRHRRIKPQGGGTWAGTKVEQIMTSPRIAGLSTHRGEIVSKGAWRAIITADEHETLCALGAARLWRLPRDRWNALPLLGFLYCAGCGQALGPAVTSGVRRYHCPGPTAPTVTIKGEWAEQAARDYVCAELAKRHSLARRRFANGNPAAIDQIRTELRGLAAQRAFLQNERRRGRLARESYAGQASGIAYQVLRAQRLLADLRHPPEPVPLPTTKAGMTALWERSDGPARRRLIGAVVDRGIVHPRGRRNGYVPIPERIEWHPLS